MLVHPHRGQHRPHCRGKVAAHAFADGFGADDSALEHVARLVGSADAVGDQLLQLTERVDARKLPFIDVVDMRIEAMKQRTLPALSGRLVQAIVIHRR